MSLVATDSHGYYLNIGYGSSERFKKVGRFVQINVLIMKIISTLLMLCKFG